IVPVWLGFAIIVGVAANTRGRNFAGWVVLAIIISPLLAGLLLLALPRGEKQVQSRREQEQQDRREGVFRPDGIIENTPYRVLTNGEVEAMMQGGIVRFQSLDHLRSMINPTRLVEKTERNEKNPREGSETNFICADNLALVQTLI